MKPLTSKDTVARRTLMSYDIVMYPFEGYEPDYPMLCPTGKYAMETIFVLVYSIYMSLCNLHASIIRTTIH